MYDRKFWTWFGESIGLTFTQNNNEKPIIYYAGLTEDHIDASECDKLHITILENLDFIVFCIYYTQDDVKKMRKVIVSFEDIEEVQTIMVAN